MAAFQVLLLLCGVVLLSTGSCFGHTIVSQDDEDRAINATRELVQRLEQEMPTRIRNPLAKLIRLLFHDCVVRGCDGCVDLDHVDNNGLVEISQELNTIYDDQFNSSGMSRGDFYALAAVVAIRMGSEGQTCMQLHLPPGCTIPVPVMAIRYGRKDCATSPNSPSDSGFPDPHGDLEHVMEVFRDGMGMTEREVVAIIGAHTMGRASPENSGFQGPWAPHANRFHNGFYHTLLANASGWHQSELNFNDAPQGLNPRFQWDTGNVDRQVANEQQLPDGARMMLNTDMALLKQVMPNENGREMNDECRDLFLNCPASRTAAIVKEYAHNNEKWIEDFGRAFQILLEHGYPDNHLVAAGQALPQLIDPTIRTPTTEDPTIRTPTTEGPTSSVPATRSNATLLMVACLVGGLASLFY